MYLYEKIELDKKEKEKRNKIYEEVKPLKEEEKEKRYVELMGSMSHTYGNVLAFIQNWTMNLFPENMFKTIHVNSKIAHRQIRSTPHEYIKKTKPMIIFRPRIPGRGEDVFLQGTPFIERRTDLFNTWGRTNLQPMFNDPKNDMSIKYQLNRNVMYVDVVVVLSTLMQQLDYYHYLNNAVRIEHPFMLPTCLESYIPQEMLSIIADCVGIPLYDEHGSTKEFLSYMNQNSQYPITYKLQGSTKSREFYRYYPANIETTITDLDKDDGERVGNIMDHYNISFTIKLEFNSTGFYYIISDKLYKMPKPTFNPETSDIIPVFTDIFTEEDLNLQHGWHLYNRASCRLEDPNDTINIDQLLNDSIREAIKYHLDNGLPLIDLIDIKVRKQGHMIKMNESYTIDWKTLDVKFINQSIYHTYTFAVTINVEYINNLIKAVYNLK